MIRQDALQDGDRRVKFGEIEVVPPTVVSNFVFYCKIADRHDFTSIHT